MLASIRQVSRNIASAQLGSWYSLNIYFCFSIFPWFGDHDMTYPVLLFVFLFPFSPGFMDILDLGYAHFSQNRFTLEIVNSIMFNLHIEAGFLLLVNKERKVR